MVIDDEEFEAPFFADETFNGLLWINRLNFAIMDGRKHCTLDSTSIQNNK